jgi:hypothetical protein
VAAAEVAEGVSTRDHELKPCGLPQPSLHRKMESRINLTGKASNYRLRRETNCCLKDCALPVRNTDTWLAIVQKRNLCRPKRRVNLQVLVHIRPKYLQRLALATPCTNPPKCWIQCSSVRCVFLDTVEEGGVPEPLQTSLDSDFEILSQQSSEDFDLLSENVPKNPTGDLYAFYVELMLQGAQPYPRGSQISYFRRMLRGEEIPRLPHF